jgi:hypothetical protein
MSTAQASSNLGGTLLMFLCAAAIIAGAVAGIMLAGLGGLILWFVGLTAVAFVLMVLVAAP